MNFSEEKQSVERKVKVPPVVIYSNIDNHSQTMMDLRKELLEDFSLSCKNNRTIIYTKNMVDYKKVCDKISAAMVSYHTYTPESEKPIRSILKGLASNITEDEVKADLMEKNLRITEVKQFIKKVAEQNGQVTEVKLPIFSIKFDQNTKVAEFKKVRYVCWCSQVGKKH